jgi:hypothetical protein
LGIPNHRKADFRPKITLEARRRPNHTHRLKPAIAADLTFDYAASASPAPSTLGWLETVRPYWYTHTWPPFCLTGLVGIGRRCTARLSPSLSSVHLHGLTPPLRPHIRRMQPQRARSLISVRPTHPTPLPHLKRCPLNPDSVRHVSFQRLRVRPRLKPNPSSPQQRLHRKPVMVVRPFITGPHPRFPVLHLPVHALLAHRSAPVGGTSAGVERLQRTAPAARPARLHADTLPATPHSGEQNLLPRLYMTLRHNAHSFHSTLFFDLPFDVFR